MRQFLVKIYFEAEGRKKFFMTPKNCISTVKNVISNEKSFLSTSKVAKSEKLFLIK